MVSAEVPTSGRGKLAGQGDQPVPCPLIQLADRPSLAVRCVSVSGTGQTGRAWGAVERTAAAAGRDTRSRSPDPPIQHWSPLSA
jgi:hypothetical protein